MNPELKKQIRGMQKEMFLRGLESDEAHTQALLFYKKFHNLRAHDRSVVSNKKIAPVVQANWAAFTAFLDRNGWPREKAALGARRAPKAARPKASGAKRTPKRTGAKGATPNKPL